MKIRNPLLIKLAATVFANLVRLLFLTLRLDVRTRPDANPYAASGDVLRIYAVWHDSMVIAAFGGKHARTVALTSNHRDGSFVAGVLQAIGVPVVRGSTGGRGDTALRRIFSEAAEKDIVITPDGPRGPNRKMSRGVVYLASRSGRTIVPTAFTCENCWRIRGSWCDLLIPKPFSRVYLLAGDPISVPPGIGREELVTYAAAVQEQMDRLDAAAQQLIAHRTQSSSSSEPRSPHRSNAAAAPDMVHQPNAVNSTGGHHLPDRVEKSPTAVALGERSAARQTLG